MPHIPGHTSKISPNSKNGNQASMKVYGTNEAYVGRTVRIGGFDYTTIGGALEGTSVQLVPMGNRNQNNNTKAFGDDLGLDDFDLSLPSPSRLTNQNNSTRGFGDDLGLVDFDANKPGNTMSSPPKTTPNIPKGFGDDLGLDDYDANKPPNPMSNTSNPVTRTFVSRVAYYTRDGSTVNPGTELHQHADGTVMLGHDPNNMGAIVTTNRTINRTTRQTQRGTQTSTSTRQTTRRTQARTGTMNTRRSTGGGGY